MSELSRITKLESCACEWLRTNSASSDQMITTRIRKDAKTFLDSVVSDMMPSVLKLVNKTKEKDSVTGEPRCGPKHNEKIKTLFDKITALQQNLEAFLVGSNSEDIISNDDNEDDKVHNGLAPDAIYTDSTVFDTRLGFQESSRLNTIVKTTMQRQDELAAIAEALDPLASTKTELKNLLLDINSNAANSSKENFMTIIGNLKTNAANTSESSTSSATLMTQLRFMQSVMSNICSHPDNEKLRKIRVQHPIVYTKLVQPIGGLLLLSSCGFKIICEVEDKTDDITTVVKEAAASDGADEVVLGVHAVAGTLPADTSTSSLLNAAHTLSLPVNAVLIEPNVEDTMKWVAWFDTLTAVRDVLSVEVGK